MTSLSLEEQQFKSIFTDLFPNLEKYDKKPKDNKDLNYHPDFMFQHNNKTLYVNVDGLFTHSEKSIHKSIKDDCRYHFTIREKFKQKHLTIFQFRADEIFTKPEIVKSIILNYLGINSQKINARQCEVRKINRQQSNDFLNQNHLMGQSSATSFGLYFEDQLVSLMSIRRSSKYKNTIEIGRFCSKINIVVRGGFSKLLKHIEKIYNPANIISFCDLRYSDGHSYLKNDFKIVSTSLGWQWTDYNKTYNRLSCRANMDSRKLTQAAQAEEFGWVKIYDAGQAKYVKLLKSFNSSSDNLAEIDLKPEKDVIICWTEDQETILKQKIIELKDLSLESLSVKLKKYFTNKTTKMIKAKLNELKNQQPGLFIHQFSNWTTLEIFPQGNRIKCRCQCGTEKQVLKSILYQGKSKSCGCKKSEFCSVKKNKERT